ncbi:MAG: dTDP-4-dehydrorhamnose reductase [bacterium]|nr:dTDP-4-dehydrorhamnose reductase [bacterium]
MSKVLISGGGGQLAQDCERVLQGPSQVLSLSKAQWDIADRDQSRAILERERPDFLINCAAYNRVDDCEQERETADRVNHQGPKILAELCHSLGIWLVHISTDYVFDGKKPVSDFYTEEDEPAPLSVYGKSKRDGELAVMASMDHFNIIRTAWLYGMGGENFVKGMIQKALKHKSLSVVDDQWGSLTWTGRLAEQIAAILKQKKPGLYHATAEGKGTWYQATKKLMTWLNISVELSAVRTEEFPRPAPRPKNSILENRRLKLEGIHLMKPWEDDLREFVLHNKDSLLAGKGRKAS